MLAERCAKILNKKVIVIEKRSHVAGNCYDYQDTESGIMLSEYGAHIFHTNDQKVWQYLNTFTKWRPYEHRVLSSVGTRLVPVPINLDTVNTLLNKGLRSGAEMKKWIQLQSTAYRETPILNSEDSALARFGNHQLYELMFKEYTYKQWDKWPSELEPSVLERIPICFDQNDRYFSDTYEAIPLHGYTDLVEKMLDHPLIEVRLNTRYEDVVDTLLYEKLLYTGPIDQYFGYQFGRSEYRSLRFELEAHNVESYQPAAVVNYPSLKFPFTRIIEFKKLYPSKSNKTIISKEFPTWGGEPYYPVPTAKNRKRYEQYQYLAENAQQDAVFVGRLANYKYFNMDQAVRNSLDVFEKEFL